MIKHKTIIRSTVSFFLGAAFSISAFAAPSDDFFTPLNLGPGFDSLSQNDEYASYQWGLKNDGQFQLVRMIGNNVNKYVWRSILNFHNSGMEAKPSCLGDVFNLFS